MLGDRAGHGPPEVPKLEDVEKPVPGDALSEDPAAIRYLEGGHARGKVVIAVE